MMRSHHILSLGLELLGPSDLHQDPSAGRQIGRGEHSSALICTNRGPDQSLLTRLRLTRARQASAATNTGFIERAFKRTSVPKRCLQGFLHFPSVPGAGFGTLGKAGLRQCLQGLARLYAWKNAALPPVCQKTRWDILMDKSSRPDHHRHADLVPAVGRSRGDRPAGPDAGRRAFHGPPILRLQRADQHRTAARRTS